MIARALLMLGLMGAAAVATAWRARPIVGPILRAPADRRFDHPGRRLQGVLRAVGFHERLLQRPLAGTLHAMIFVSFFVLATAIVQAFGSGLLPGFSLRPIGGDTWIALLQDVFALVMLLSVGLACYQRFVLRPPRFKGSNARDASVIYLLIGTIVVSMLLEAAFGLAAGHGVAAWRPIAGGLARVMGGIGLSPAGADRGREAFFWVHVCAILAFLVYLPRSKHRHMVTAAPNIFFRSLAPKGQSAEVPADRPSPGLADIDQMSWKNKLDLVSCTECGRCQAACPAYASGLPLSPKTLIMDLRDHMVAREAGADTPLVARGDGSGAITPETLWACTTCRACMEVCPVNIEHLPKIVDMRRELVEQGTMEPMLQDALSNLQRTGNSMGKAAKMRARWTKDLPFKIKDARKTPVDILWFVGDFASYDPRGQKTTIRVAELLHEAGVDFGLLFEAEQNSGNDVRRVGEEGLFETLARANIAALQACTFNRIVTTDPHSLNALRNEYPTLGASFDVLHYTEFFAELTAAGRLALKPAVGGMTVTYHDPCYLGRYNGAFDAPRTLIEKAGHILHDMPRCRENSFCCGAGGGRIWADDSGMTERPSENRIREALALGDAGKFVVACPKDKVMYTAAVQNLGVEDKIEVVDIAELLVAAQSEPTGVDAHERSAMSG